MTDATILLLFPGLFACSIGIVVFAAGGPDGGKSYFAGKKGGPLDFRTLLFFSYLAVVAAHFILV